MKCAITNCEGEGQWNFGDPNGNQVCDACYRKLAHQVIVQTTEYVSGSIFGRALTSANRHVDDILEPQIEPVPKVLAPNVQIMTSQAVLAMSNLAKTHRLTNVQVAVAMVVITRVLLEAAKEAHKAAVVQN